MKEWIAFGLMFLIATLPTIYPKWVIYKYSGFRKSGGSSFFNTLKDPLEYNRLMAFHMIESLETIKGHLASHVSIDGLSEPIDLCLVHPTGVHLFKTVYETGRIEGDVEGAHWKAVLKNGKEKSFQNPMKALEKTVQDLSTALGLAPEQVKGWLVFSERSDLTALDLATGRPVLNRSGLQEALARTLGEGEVKLEQNESEKILELLERKSKVKAVKLPLDEE